MNVINQYVLPDETNYLLLEEKVEIEVASGPRKARLYRLKQTGTLQEILHFLVEDGRWYDLNQIDSLRILSAVKRFKMDTEGGVFFPHVIGANRYVYERQKKIGFNRPVLGSSVITAPPSELNVKGPLFLILE